MGRRDNISNQIAAKVHTRAMGSGRQGLKRIKQSSLKHQPALTRSSVRRLARRAGVKRISSGIYEEAPTALRTWLNKIVQAAVVFTEHARRKTVTMNDILMALKRNGITLYGYDITERRRRLIRPVSREALTTAAQRVAARNAQKQSSKRRRQAVEPPAAAIQEEQQQEQEQQQEEAVAVVEEQQEQEQIVEAVSSPMEPSAVPSPDAVRASTTPQTAEAVAPTDALLEVSPERAQEIQTSLAAFRDTVLARQSSSDAKVGRILDWITGHLSGRGVRPCSGGELEVVLDVLADRDAVMLTEDDGTGDKVVWFV